MQQVRLGVLGRPPYTSNMFMSNGRRSIILHWEVGGCGVRGVKKLALHSFPRKHLKVSFPPAEVFCKLLLLLSRLSGTEFQLLHTSCNGRHDSPRRGSYILFSTFLLFFLYYCGLSVDNVSVLPLEASPRLGMLLAEKCGGRTQS